MKSIKSKGMRISKGSSCNVTKSGSIKMRSGNRSAGKWAKKAYKINNKRAK
ncbi:hypothetical protein AAEX28_01955 [Lentisphaerota bacterium WC36G]|nr:hypothetical protein LJT99_04840 [Lentisphaerae bacterium WC36]